MNNNGPLDLHDDEKLPPELADFESRLKSLKPVAMTAFENARNSREIRTRNRSREHSECSERSDRKTRLLLRFRSLCYALFSAASLVLALAMALSLLIVLTLFRLENDNILPNVNSDNGQHVAENPMPDVPMPEAAPEVASVVALNHQQPDTHSTSRAFRGGVTMREQLAMLLEELQPPVAVTVEPKQPDYPVMVIPVGQNTQPLSPEAKQAFQRRLQSRFDTNVM